jgi:hypothetical protein
MSRVEALAAKAKFILEKRGVEDQKSVLVGRTRNGVKITGCYGLDDQMEVLEIALTGPAHDQVVLVPSAFYASGDWEQSLDRWHDDILADRA